MSTCDKLTGTLTLGATMSGGLLVAKGEKGDKGDKGDAYIITEADKQEIKEALSADISELKVDLTDSRKAIAELNDKKIAKFYANSLGETTLNDSDKGKIQDMILYGKSLQNGTPTPDNPIEIQSVVNPTIKVIGKNLFNPHNSEQINIINHNDSIEVVSNNETPLFSGNKLRKGVTYFVNVKANKEIANIRIYGDFESSNLIQELETESYEYKFSFVASDDGYLRIWLRKGTYIFTQLSVSEESYYDGDFELYKEQSATLPYTLNAIPVSSGGNVTIDGQQYIADYVDVERKKLIRNVGEVDLGSLMWYSWWEEQSNPKRAYSYLSDKKKGLSNMLCVSYMNSYVDDGSLTNGKITGNNTNNIIYIKDERFDTFNEWKQAIKGVKLLYELATPTETDLTDEEVQAFKELATYYPTTNVMVTSDQLDGFTTFNYPISMANGWNYVKEQLGDTRDYIYDMDLQSAEAYVNSEYAVTLTELEV